MNRQQRILILTSDSGFGHRSAANSICKAFNLSHQNETIVKIINPIMDQRSSAGLKKTERDYDHRITTYPAFYRFTYEISDSRKISSLVESTLTVALQKSIRQIIRNFRPDAILNTNLMFNAPTGFVLNTLKNRIPFFTVITDLADVHALWFNSRPDMFFVASESVRTKAIASGIPDEKITITGIPVDPSFGFQSEPKSILRENLGLDPDLPTLLFVGSPRVSGIMENLIELEKNDHPFQTVVIAGGDNSLYNDLCNRQWKFPICIRNFVTNIPEWMMCADILITKAGGLILSEGLAAGLPIILIDNLPGQEEGNIRFIIDNHAGVHAKTPADLNKIVDNWLKNNRSVLLATAEKSRKIGNPEAAAKIAEIIWEKSGSSHRQITNHRFHARIM